MYQYRIDFGGPPWFTASEGVGYGMILAAHFGDSAIFDRHWKVTHNNVSTDALVGWIMALRLIDAARRSGR